MVNFYNHFILHAAPIMPLLYEALRGSKVKQEVNWLPERILLFKKAKTVLSCAAMLEHPSPAASILLTTGSSNYTVGALSEQ